MIFNDQGSQQCACVCRFVWARLLQSRLQAMGGKARQAPVKPNSAKRNTAGRKGQAQIPQKSTAASKGHGPAAEQNKGPGQGHGQSARAAKSAKKPPQSKELKDPCTVQQLPVSFKHVA